jgi:hypothetical protein
MWKSLSVVRLLTPILHATVAAWPYITSGIIVVSSSLVCVVNQKERKKKQLVCLFRLAVRRLKSLVVGGSAGGVHGLARYCGLHWSTEGLGRTLWSVHNIGVVCSSLRRSIVGTVRTVSGVALVGLGCGVSIGAVDLVVLVAGSSNSTAGVGGIVRGTDIVGVVSGEAASSNGSGSGHLSIPIGGLRLALPEVALCRAAGVVVGWARAETLVLLVLADEEDLEERSHQEEEDANNADSENSCVHAAGSAGRYRVGEVLALSGAESILSKAFRVHCSVANAKRGVHDSSAGLRAAAGKDSDGDETTDEKDVEDDRSDGEEADATEAASKNHSRDGVEHSNTGDTLNSLLPCGDALIAVCAYCEEVGVNAW